MPKRRTVGGGAIKSGFGYSGFGAHDQFTELIDCPASYAGQAGKVVIVNPAESGLIFNTEAAIDRHDVMASTGDPTPNFLDSKITAGNGLATQVITSPFPPNEKFLELNMVLENDSLDFVGVTLRARPANVNAFFDPTTGLPVLPANKDKYIASATGSGWTIHNEYEYDDTALIWNQFVPTKGLVRYVIALDQFWYYNGIIWTLTVAVPAAHDLAGALHNADTITNLNLKLSDGDVISTKAGEIAAIAAKAVPITADYLLIEDSADTNKKKSITIGTLPAAAPASHALAGALHSADTITNLNTKLSDGDVISTKAGEIAALTEKTSLAAGDMFLIEDSADTNNKKRLLASNMLGNLKTKGNGVYNPSGITMTVNMIAWRAPYACTVTNVRGYRVGGTGATINARLNGASNHLASALSLSSADTWMDGGAVQNTAYAAGDKLEVMVVTVTGGPTQILIQVDFKRV
jgi:hypothetical protein